jgi:hypothetical protein
MSIAVFKKDFATMFQQLEGKNFDFKLKTGNSAMFIENMAYLFLLDYHKWEKTEFSVEEMDRVKRDFTFRINQLLPFLLVDNDLFTKEMLVALNVKPPMPTLWQKIKFCFTILFKK